MNKVWIALLFLMGALVVACQAESQPTGTPQPIPTIGRAPFGAAPVKAISLLRMPADYLNLDIELAGQYKPLPLLVCGEDTHASPATWAIVDGEIEILAAGYDEPLRELAYPGQDLVVEGRWQQWEGPVGCGRRLPAEKIWYLVVSSIVSPNPLVAADGSENVIAELPTVSAESESPEGSGDESLTQTAEALDQVLTPEPTLPGDTGDQGTSTPALTTTPAATTTASATATASRTGTATSPAGAGGTSTATPTRASTATPTPGQTSTAGPTSTASATSANTATATTVAGESTPIGYEDLKKRNIVANGSHTYQFVAGSGDMVNIAAAPQNGLDISIQLIGPNGTTLLTQALTGPGQVESLGPITLANSGVHKVIIRSVNGSGWYALIVQETDALPYVIFKGNIDYGDTVGGSVAIDRDHLWNFMASAGDVVTIGAVATTDTDLILYLNDPDSLELDFADEDLSIGPPDDEEIILQLQLMDDGMYTIGVGEIDFNTIGYNLTLSRN